MEVTIDHILPILRKASGAILEIYSDANLFNTETKADLSPLTAADHQSNELIIDGLAALFPDIPVVSEESFDDDYKVRASFHQYFLVDPLDGTKEFIKRNGEFTINIAYMQEGIPVAGFIFIPESGMAYYGIRGQGAFRINSQDDKVPLRSTPFSLMQPGLRVFASRSHSDERTVAFIGKLNHAEMISSGSSLKFLRIAEGVAHIYPRRAPTMEWDTAAAQCILEEAGGCILSLENLKPLTYNKEDLTNPHFVAFGSLLDPETLMNII